MTKFTTGTARPSRSSAAEGGKVGGNFAGAPLLLLHTIGDGDIDWDLLLPHLTGRFTCHLPSLRGRGLSGDHPDLSPGRLFGDFLAYVDSIGEPTGLVGWSGGGTWALGAAAQSDTVAAVAPFEPGMLSLMDAQEQAALGAAVARTGEMAAEGRLADAARAFAGFPFNDEEIAVAERRGLLRGRMPLRPEPAQAAPASDRVRRPQR